MSPNPPSSTSTTPTPPTDRPKLELILDGACFPCREGDVIGREGTVATTRLVQANRLSRKHLAISWRDHPEGETGGDWLLNLTPTARNETLLDGRALLRDTPHALSAGSHRIDVTSFSFILRVAAPAAAEEGAESTAYDSRFTNMVRLREQFGDDGLLRLIADNVADLIAIIDTQGKRVWNNAAYYTRLGYNPEEIHRSYSMLEIHPDDLPLVKRTFDESMATGHGRRIEYRMRHRDGRWVHLESQGSVVQAMGKGEGKYLVLVARDITARKDAEQKARLRDRRQVERTATLARFTQSAQFQEGDLAACFTQVTEAAVGHFDCERAGVWLVSSDNAALVCQDLFAPGAAAGGHRREGTLAAAGCGQFLAKMRTERCLAVDNARKDPRVEELRGLYLMEHGVSSFLAARISLGSELLGMLTLERTDAAEHWSLEDQGFAASLADLLLLALQARKRAEAFAALQESQRQLAAELAEAAGYVRALLPTPMKGGEVESEWRFVPCSALGGDSFGHHWLDQRHLAIYLFDVAGHGVGASLLSMSALNMLRSGGLPGVDFHDPAAVLGGLNRAFQMERQGGMFFTAWYGVYDRETRRIAYSAAGHPPPVLFGLPPGGVSGPASAPPVLLGVTGLMIGADADAVFVTETASVPAPAKLYVFSDGVFEIARLDGGAWGFDQFVELLGQAPRPGISDLEGLQRHIQEVQGSPELPDDFSILRLVFH